MAFFQQEFVTLDGHQHLHIFPAVRKAAIGAAKKHGIPWIRIAHEPCPVLEEEQIPEDLKSEAKRFSVLSAKAFPLLAGTGIRATDHFCCLYLKGRLRILEKCGDLIVSQAMVHPGGACETEQTLSGFFHDRPGEGA
jgi:predicted glycoside hydrolase/deacetylase ChbG (UPF0249 family)